ncbi:unnamed protein product, partial [Rhizoctonia solani]
RQEAIRVHRAYLDRYLAGDRNDDAEDTDKADLRDVVGEYRSAEGASSGDNGQLPESEVNGDGDGGDDPNLVPEPIAYPNPVRRMATAPTVSKTPIQEVIDRYHAPNIISGITDFLTRRCGVSRHDVLVSPQNRVDIWHKLYLYHPPPFFAPFDPVRRDVVRARAPASRTKLSNKDPGVWDVALYLERPNRLRSREDQQEKHGIERYRAGRVRAFFTLPTNLQFFYPSQLAYIEVFTPFNASASPFTGLHATKPDCDSNGLRRTLVVPVSDIVFACHLVPKFQMLDSEIELHRYTDLLSIAPSFWLNHYYNYHFFQLIQHWKRRRSQLRERLIRNVQRSQALARPSQ